MIYLPSNPSVIGIFGSLGGGKTLSAVDCALYFINHFNFVVTNIQLKNLSQRQQSYYKFYPDISKIDWFALPVGSPRGTSGNKRVAVILDELPELLSQYTSGKDYWVQVFLSWLRMTSKNGQYVFVITQDPSFIMKPVRLLCAYWLRCEDMAEFRIPIIRLKIPFVKDFVARRLFDRDGKQVQASLNYARKSVIGRYYTTSQGLSLHTSTSNIPNEFKNSYQRQLENISKYNFFFRFQVLTIIYVLIAFLFFFFIL